MSMKARESEKGKEKKREKKTPKRQIQGYIERKTDMGSIRKRQEDPSSVTAPVIKKGFT